jgi:UDP-GlcNAc:undecaprenyl-phosphate GlcNAc-1-phosphate transferase
MLVNPFVTSALAFALAAVATPLVRAGARRIGAVAAPKADRWHKAPTAMLGGIAIYAATMIALLVLAPHANNGWIVIAASSALFVVGLVDDFVTLKPYQKLVGQLLGAAAVVYFGLVLPWTASFGVNMIITFVWLVGVTNAVNMLDNMDGLAAGIAAIASMSLAINFFYNGQSAEALMLAAFCGALLGFLIYNHNPASIFMGDSGSMFVGFFLASAALLNAQGGGGRSRSVVGVLAIPVLVLCIPIFDTTFVTLMRKLAGRAASQGGRDHTSHRLVALGLSERRAVWMLYLFAIMGGALALGVRRFSLDISIAAIAGFAILLGLLGVYLAGVRVYSEAELSVAQRKPIVSFLLDLSYKRRVFEVILDVVLISLAYSMSFAAAFGPSSKGGSEWKFFFETLPAVVFLKLATFLAVGIYKGLWRYASISDVTVHVRAVVISSVVCVFVAIFAFGHPVTGTQIVVDAALLMTFLTGSRFAFRAFRSLMPTPHARTGRRVLVFGAGDGGELLYRELQNNARLHCVPVAFVDDDGRKAGKLLHGLRIYDGKSCLEQLCKQLNVAEVVLSTTRIPATRLRELVQSCEKVGVPVKRMNIELQRIADTELGWVLPTDSIIATTIAAQIAVEKAPMLPIDKRHSSAARLTTES